MTSVRQRALKALADHRCELEKVQDRWLLETFGVHNRRAFEADGIEFRFTPIPSGSLSIQVKNRQGKWSDPISTLVELGKFFEWESEGGEAR